MINKVKTFVEKENLIQKGDSIVVGVSGGADSICLLLFLCAMKEEYNLKLQVVHINHQLRDEAKEEANYVASLCKKLKVSCFVKEINVLDYAKSEKLSCEEAARYLRYKEFRRWLVEEKFSKIAVAHHMNDQAETFLFRVIRGTGYVGMQGMKGQSDAIIRPLLCLKKEEITLYLKRKHIVWMEDESNQDNSFSRNMIRNEVIPTLCKINGQAVEHIYEITKDMREIESFANEILTQKYQTYVKEKEGKACIKVAGFQDESNFVQKHIVKMCIEKAAGKQKDISKIHVLDVLNLWGKQVGKQISLPYDLTAVKEYHNIVIFRNNQQTDENCDLQIGELTINDGIDEKQGKKDCIQIIDYDKIKGRIQLRYRKDGDYFMFDRQGRRKSLNRYFIDQKIPRDQRDKIPLVADGNHIIWIVGMRMSEYYKVSQDTKRKKQLKYTRRN